MNYLAHAYFSFNEPSILLGNMISDFVKGKKQYDYPPAVQKGIRLHRAIDAYTDGHAITKEIKAVFSPAVRLYAGAFTDVVYDHFLALHPQELMEQEWMNFSTNTYSLLSIHSAFFPEKFAILFPYMQQQNWLFNYRYAWGIENSFGGLQRRAKYLHNAYDAYKLFEENYVCIALLANQFIPDVKKFAFDEFQRLMHE